MKRFHCLLTGVLILGLAAGCNGGSRGGGGDGGGGPGDGGGGNDGGGDGGGGAVAEDQACETYLAVACAFAFRCLPYSSTVIYGDPRTCAERARLVCGRYFFSRGSNLTPRWLLDCAEAYNRIACDDLFSDSLPAACRPVPGQLADGAACGSGIQCRSSYCRLEASGCGRCVQGKKAGERCATVQECEPGLLCLGSGMDQKCTTITYVGEGASCGGANVCRFPSLSCEGGRCVKLLGLGEACDPQRSLCNIQSALFCSTASRKCEAIRWAKINEACSRLEGPHCMGGATCKIPMGLTMGTCVAPVRDGEMCDPAKDLVCQAPAGCTAGTCQIHDPSMCR
jgi:hypothetical protein